MIGLLTSQVLGVCTFAAGGNCWETFLRLYTQESQQNVKQGDCPTATPLIFFILVKRGQPGLKKYQTPLYVPSVFLTKKQDTKLCSQSQIYRSTLCKSAAAIKAPLALSDPLKTWRCTWGLLNIDRSDWCQVGKGKQSFWSYCLFFLCLVWWDDKVKCPLGSFCHYFYCILRGAYSLMCLLFKEGGFWLLSVFLQLLKVKRTSKSFS